MAGRADARGFGSAAELFVVRSEDGLVAQAAVGPRVNGQRTSLFRGDHVFGSTFAWSMWRTKRKNDATIPLSSEETNAVFVLARALNGERFARAQYRVERVFREGPELLRPRSAQHAGDVKPASLSLLVVP